MGMLWEFCGRDVERYAEAKASIASAQRRFELALLDLSPERYGCSLPPKLPRADALVLAAAFLDHSDLFGPVVRRLAQGGDSARSW